MNCFHTFLFQVILYILYTTYVNFENPSGGYPRDPCSSYADITPVLFAFFGMHSDTFGRSE